MALLEHELEVVARGLYVHTLELPRLELTPLIGVEGEVAQLGVLHLPVIGRNLGVWHIDIQFNLQLHIFIWMNLGGYLTLVAQELHLLDAHRVDELQRYLLGVLTVLGSLPSYIYIIIIFYTLRLRRLREEFAYRVIGFLTCAFYYPEHEFR